MRCWTSKKLEIQELEQRAPHLVAHRIRDGTEIAPEQIIVPGEDLIDQDVAISRETTHAGGDAHAQWKGCRTDHPRRQRQYHCARQPGFAELRWLYCEAGPLFAGFRADTRIERHHVEVPLLRDGHPPSIEAPQAAVWTEVAQHGTALACHRANGLTPFRDPLDAFGVAFEQIEPGANDIDLRACAETLLERLDPFRVGLLQHQRPAHHYPFLEFICEYIHTYISPKESASRSRLACEADTPGQTGWLT